MLNDWDSHIIYKKKMHCGLFGNASFFNSLLKFRMWFNYGLKAQKLLAQGIALGMMAISKAPCKGKSLMFCLEF